MQNANEAGVMKVSTNSVLAATGSRIPRTTALATIAGPHRSMPFPPIDYGADRSGLIWGFLFDQHHNAVAIDSRQAASWLSKTRQGEEFVWLHLNLAHAATEKWLHEHIATTEELHAALHDGSRSTRIELVDDTLVVVLNNVLHSFSLDSA